MRLKAPAIRLRIRRQRPVVRGYDPFAPREWPLGHPKSPLRFK